MRAIKKIVVAAIGGASLIGCAGSASASAASPSTPIATPPANCAAMVSPYDYTQAAAQSCYPTYPLVSITTMPGGGQSYNYSENGQTVSETYPPQSFNILQASAAQLQEYGLPARPTTQSGLAQWQSDYQNAKFAGPPSFLAGVPHAASLGPTPPVSGASNAPPQLAQPSDGAPSGAGIQPDYVNNQYAGWYAPGGFTSGSSTFTEPSLKPVSCSEPAESPYTALGSSATTFGQDGTYSFPNDNHHAYWEAFHVGATSPASATLFTASAGNNIRANINYGSTAYTGTVTDTSTGVVNGFNSGGGFDTPPAQVQAVVEQPAGFDMADFTSVPFSGSTGDSVPISEYLEYGDFTNSPNETTGGINSNGGFTITWNHC